ncbi:MAG: cytochrome-c oxidase, cbb3-type subunit III [Thermaurantiacus sp.]
MAKPERDPLTGQWTTGHSWDGIKELKTPVPIWWVSTFLISVAFAIVYVVLNPSFPSPDGRVFALNPVSTRDALEIQREAARVRLAGMSEEILSRPIEELGRDEELARFAFNAGRALYQVHCIGCHGPGAGGQAGQFPALVNDDWLWGGTKEDIHQTIRYGIRNDHPDARQSQMPIFGQVLQPGEIDQLTDYVLVMGEVPAGHSRRVNHPAHELYQQQCAACHGEDGRGNVEFGAPNLTDAIWLYGGTRAEIRRQIAWPRMGVMPGFHDRLTDSELKMLTVYVHGLGGGQPPRAPEPAAPESASAAAAGQPG